MVKLHTECQRLKLPENTIYFNIFVWVVCWGFFVCFVFKSHHTEHIYLKQKVKRQAKFFSFIIYRSLTFKTYLEVNLVTKHFMDILLAFFRL